MRKLTTFIALTMFTGISQAGTILLTQFDFQFSGGVDVYQQMEANLEAAGHTVDIVDAKTGGNVAAALSSTSYDQVFLWDLTSSLSLNNTDITALSNFWSTDMGLVVDTRSYGHYFQGSDASEVALLQNMAENLDLSGGGLWIGTDHDPDWTKNANPVLSELGINPVTGLFSDPVNFADPTSVLLDGVITTDLWGGGASVGQAPIGVQPNGVEMFIHYGHERADGSILPYISASFDLEGPQAVPEPSLISLMGLSLIALGFVRRRKQL